ncbi:MAG TPA: diacylglycerol kinase family protein [Solirubrobacteraceae bacterium]|jgi:diacylglycerol kinase family enzyme|nr:diacylglycerol kinase family protein [Solirubrobacteraceae bacterium]
MPTTLPARERRNPEYGDAHLELNSTPPKKRMLIVVNPYASTVSDGLRHLVVNALRGRFEVDARDTEARGHATVLCREAAHEGYDVVVAFGGDGTVNEAANGLLGSSTPLTCLPGGSANVFGKMLGIPGELVAATDHLLGLADDWRVRKVDLGVVNGRCFTFASGLGLDASVVERVDANPRRKARWGPWFFTWVAVTTFARRYLVHPPRLTVHAAGKQRPGEQIAADSGEAGRRASDALDGVTAIVQNGSPFTYFNNRPIEIADDAHLDSGTLSTCVLHRARPLDMPSITLRAFAKRARLTRHRQITALAPATELVVRSADERPLPLQVDGDYLGEVDEARYSVMPQALNVVA